MNEVCVCEDKKIGSIRMHPVETVHTRPPFLSTSQLRTGEIAVCFIMGERVESERVHPSPSEQASVHLRVYVCVPSFFFFQSLSVAFWSDKRH